MYLGEYIRTVYQQFITTTKHIKGVSEIFGKPPTARESVKIKLKNKLYLPLQSLPF